MKCDRRTYGTDGITDIRTDGQSKNNMTLQEMGDVTWTQFKVVVVRLTWTQVIAIYLTRRHTPLVLI